MPKAAKKKRPSPARRPAPKAAAPVHDPDRHTDGCDVDFLAVAATPDVDLPPARGGVEAIKPTRKR